MPRTLEQHIENCLGRTMTDDELSVAIYARLAAPGSRKKAKRAVRRAVARYAAKGLLPHE